jgi:hypothetical protein
MKKQKKLIAQKKKKEETLNLLRGHPFLHMAQSI